MHQRSLFPPFDHHAQQPAPDICAGRHGGADTSVEAHERSQAEHAHDWAAVLAYIRQCGTEGATSKQVALHLGKPLNCVSGRCSELIAAQLIVDSGRRRDGCRVMVARECMYR